MNVSDRGIPSYGHHLAFAIACLVVPYAGIYLELAVLDALYDLVRVVDLPISLIRLITIGVPTLTVGGVVWLLSDRWYRRRTAYISTVAVSVGSLLVYATIAFLFTSPIG